VEVVPKEPAKSNISTWEAAKRTVSPQMGLFTKILLRKIVHLNMVIALSLLFTQIIFFLEFLAAYIAGQQLGSWEICPIPSSSFKPMESEAL
jgi:hypothetical protein